GLFGSQDPTYDGVYRQSYALLGLAATDTRAPRVTIEWLLSQQCADGSFVAYRADLDVPCPAPDPVAYTGPDTNSTSLAALALLEHGEARAARRAIDWLTRIQLRGGGWGYVEGSPADSTSTALSLEAIASVKGNAPQQRAATRGLVRQMGLSAIVVTHDLAVVRLLADRLMVMQGGRVVEAGLTDQVLDDPAHPYTQLLVSSVLQV
ncbi:MAG: hypothetical protein ACO3FX_08535, partial [Gemmobacter sp.]